MNMLLIDDDEFFCRAFKTLQDESDKVEVVNDIMEAEPLIDSCDVILLDYYLGSTTTAKSVIRSIRGRKPITVVSGSDDQENIDAVLSLGCVDFILKSPTMWNEIKIRSRLAVERFNPQLAYLQATMPEDSPDEST